MSDILTGFNMQGNDPIDDRIVSKSNLETLEQYLKRVPVQKRYYGLTFFALDKNNELRKYTFQTSLINPTIDDNEEEIERIDKELQEHVSDKAIHKTSEEIRSEIVDADIPDTIARVQWTLDQINIAIVNLIGGASDEYNTLKRIQTKIEELRAKIYGDDGGTVLKTLEQALKFLNQYKDFIVDIPENFVNKQDIVDNLTTDDPTKVLSAKQGKVLSDTLTNYFESAMQSIRTETDRAINAENRIESKLDKEIDRSIKEDQRIDAKLDAEIKRSTDEDLRIDSKLDAEIERSTNEDIRIDTKLDSEINRSTTEDDRLDKKIDAETTRATDAESNLNTKIETETDRAEGEESRIETKLDNEITRSTNKDTEHDNRLQALEGQTHEQNTDLGTTNSTFQLKYNTGNKIKHESDAISVRNAADTDYVNFIAKNATFKGDLLVEGQSFVTEAETVEIKDNLLLLNKGEVGAGVTKGIAGLEIDRGTEPNYFIIFDESDNRFKAGVEGDLWNLALRESDDNMLDGYFISWNSKDKILSTTNIVNESTPLLFGRTDYKQYSGNRTDPDGNYSSYAFISEAEGNHLYNFSGSSNWNIDTDKINFRFWKPLLGTTFKRASDNSEVLYHADIVNNLTSGGTNKVLSAEQGKLLQNSITSIQGSYLPLSGGTMTGSIIFPNRKGIFGRLTDGTSNIKIAVVNANNNVEIGNLNTPLMLVSNSTDLTHYRDNNTYKIWDKFNLSDPATLSGNNTFTGNNIFQAGKFNVGAFRVTSSGSLSLDISSPAGSSWSRSLTFRANSDSTSSFIFGGYNSVDNTSIGYAYIGIGDVTYSTAQYKFYANSLKVPYKWSIDGPDGSAILWSQTSEIVNLGRAVGTTKIRSGNTDLIHTKGSTEYIIWDKSNLPNPAKSTDLANYLPLIGGTLTGQVIFDSYGLAFNNIAWTNDLAPNRNYGGYLQVLDAYNANNAGGPTNYGTVLQVNSRNAHWANQLWFSGGAEASKNGLYYRHMPYNSTTYGEWIKLATTSDLGNYLPLTGGTISSSKSNPLTINSTHANQSSINFSRGGVNKGTVGFYESLGSFLQNVTGETLAVKSDGAYYGANTNSLRKLATVTDLGSYLPLIGGTLSGQLIVGYAGSTPLIVNNSHTNGVDSILNFRVKGVNKTLVGYSNGNGPFIQDASSNRCIMVKSDGAYFGTELGAGTKLALITDIPTVSGYLPLTGGNLTGKLSIKSSGSNLLILDSSSSTESVIHFLRSSTTKGAVGYYDNIGAFIYNFPSNTYLFVKDDGKPYVGTKTNYKKILTETDITGYATQSWVNNQGYLTSHQTIYNLTFQAGTFSAKTFDPNGAAATVNIPTKTSHITNDSGFITSSALNGYATQSWCNGQFAPLSRFNTSTGYTTIKVVGQEFNFDSANPEIYMNYRTLSGSTAVTKITWKAGGGANNTALCEGRWGNLYMNDNLVATQSWAAEKFPNKTGAGASGTWGISISGNATTATTASKLGSTTIGGSAKPIYLSSGTPTACSATVGSATVPVYMNAGTITQCSTTLGVSITGNAATATNATQLGGTAASSYVKANDNISRLTNDSGYTTQEWVNGQGFLTSDSILDKFVPTTGGYIRNSDQILLRLQRTGVSTGTSRTIEMYFDDSNDDGTSTTPRGSIGYNSEVGMFLYSANSKKFLAMEYTGRPFYGTPKNRYYLLGSNTQYHNLDGYQRIGDIMIQWGYFSVQGNSTRAVNFPVSFTNTVWSVTGSWDNTTTGSQENWGFTNYTSSGFTIINGDGSSRVFHYIAIGPFTRS